MASEGALSLAPGRPRTLAFAEGVRKDLKLLELDEALLEELLQAGLTIKGEAGDEAVLCTQKKTFAIKTVETTNSVWLVHPGQAGCDAANDSQHLEPQCTPVGQLLGLATQLQRNEAAGARAPVVVSAVASSHLELTPAAPRLHKLDALLQECPYAGEEGQDLMEVDGSTAAGHSGQRHTLEELLQRVQASPAELDQALEQRRALCLDGRYCSVDPEYLGTLLEVVLLTAIEQGWEGDHVIPAHAAADALAASGYDPRVVLHCLEVYGTPANESAGGPEAGRSGSGGGLWRLDEGAVCRHFARKLLAEQAEWPVGEFMEAWTGSLPESMSPSLEMLRGEALVATQRVKRFPVAVLPADAAGRFAALFNERERWLWEDLEPYVAGLQGPGQTVEGLLLKYARTSQPKPSDPVMYSAR